MPRSIRLEQASAFYHVMARGNRRESIDVDEDDRRFFLKTLGEACAMTGCRVHAWVLTGNHYHLLIETPHPNLVAGMRWFQTTGTARFNRRHRLCGHLFQGRYKFGSPMEPSPACPLRLRGGDRPRGARLLCHGERLPSPEPGACRDDRAGGAARRGSALPAGRGARSVRSGEGLEMKIRPARKAEKESRMRRLDQWRKQDSVVA